ncbi:hypothetical protein D3C78_1484380 [compost metagenome]
MPEIVYDLLPPVQLREIIRHQTTQREPVEERAAGEENDEKNAEQEARHRITDDDDA